MDAASVAVVVPAVVVSAMVVSAMVVPTVSRVGGVQRAGGERRRRRQ
jgi:hypothetical protein